MQEGRVGGGKEGLQQEVLNQQVNVMVMRFSKHFNSQCLMHAFITIGWHYVRISDKLLLRQLYVSNLHSRNTITISC